MEYDFGLRIRELREKKHMTQDQVGKYLGVSGANISNYESNTVSPPSDAVRKMALLFGVTTDYLYGLENRKVIVLDIKSEYQAERVERILKLLEELIDGTGS